MKKYQLIILSLSLILLWSCNRQPANKDEEVSSKELAKIENLQLFSKEEGLAFLKTNCYACHNPKSESHDNMLAPPLAGIKFKYKKLYPDRAKFIARMTDYIHHPSKENTLMPGPVKRFGLMPESPLDKDNIRRIVAYIYDNPLEIPDWFQGHFEEEHGKKFEQ